MRISVMIPVYQEAELLEDIIGKILKNDYPNKEILVAVDGDTSREIEAATLPWPSVSRGLRKKRICSAGMEHNQPT